MSPRMPVLSAALAVSMAARTGSLTAHAVEDMRIRAEELLVPGEILRAAILIFATQYELHRRDPAAVIALGEALRDALADALREPPPPAADPAHWPDPVGLDRSDLNG